MPKKDTHQKGHLLPLLLAIVCIAAAALLGWRAYEIVRERRDGAQEHTEEQRFVQEGLATEGPETPQPTIDLLATPEAESLEDIAPELREAVEEAASATETPPPTEDRSSATTGSAEPSAILPPEVGATATKARSTASPSPELGESAAETPVPQESTAETPPPQESATETPPPQESTATPGPTETPRVGRVVESSVHYSVDFGQLEEINEDIRGWLVQDGTDINYPIVQAEDNTYYLTHLFNRRENRTGAVFMDSGSSRYYTDTATWLYAHNRKDGTMFASLPGYMEQAYYEQHSTMYLLTPYEDYLVEIFACVRSSTDVETEWRARSFSGRAEFDSYISRIRAQSAIETAVEVSWGDQLLVLCTCTNEVHEERYVVYGRMRPLVYVEDASEAVTTLEMSEKGSLSKTVEIPGRGTVQYYAQNDPTWYSMRYEPRTSTDRRNFGQSGCGPTAVAMALANTASEEQLYRLLFAAKTESGFSFCTCSVNQYFCNKRHVQVRVRDTATLRAYLPVVMASFATGNNAWGVQSRSQGSGTNSAFMEYVCQACQIDFRNTRDAQEAIAAVGQGAVAVFATGGAESPFTGNGHYLTLIGADEEYLYILDPFQKADYSATDKHHVLEQLEPGVLRAKRADARYLLMYSFYIFTPTA